MLPADEKFAAFAGGLGVDSGSDVVVYDGSGNNLSAARAWWMFRAYGHQKVYLLDGGLKKWQAEGRAVESGQVVRSPANFSGRLDRAQVRERMDVQRALSSGSAQVVDARSAGRYSASDPEPRAGLSSGHMPGALSLPYNELVNSDGTALPIDELRRRFTAAGVQLDRPVIASCGSGVTACNLLLALHLLGHSDGSLYDGSWTEWVTTGSPVVKGPEPGHLS
jgi:thiosulfate/3-mercaptopyruvate sulfurtransferase